MIIVYVGESSNNSIDVQLTHANMKFDPRIIDIWRRYFKVRFSVKGTTLTITRTDDDADEGWDRGFFLRAYLPTEVIPDFTSTVYTYWGLDDEHPLTIPRKSSFIRPFASSRNGLSVVVHPWCGSQYLTPSRGLNKVLSMVVIP